MIDQIASLAKPFFQHERSCPEWRCVSKMAIVISFIQNQYFKTALVDYQQMAHGEK
jgi:hypothetical protein